MQVCSLDLALNSVRPNERLNTGLDFLSLLRSEEICPRSRGLSAAIIGGAVRDVFFSNCNPNDIDIFFYANLEGGRTQQRAQRLVHIKEDLIVWLEDQDIPYESLLREPTSDYADESQRFLDIISFMWRNTKIQVMIPRDVMNTAGNIFSLVSSMPTFCLIAITLEHLVVGNTFLPAYALAERNIYPCLDSKDVAYVRKKRPNGAMVSVSSSDALIYLAFSVNTEGTIIPTEDTRTPREIFESLNLVRKQTLLSHEIRRRFPAIHHHFRDTTSVVSLNETI